MANANVFSQYLAPPKSVADYTAEADSADLRRQQLVGAQRQNAIAALMAQQQQQQMQDAAAGRSALQRIASGWGAATPTEQKIADLRNSGRMDLMAQADALEKQALERRNIDSQIDERGAKAGRERASTLDQQRQSFIQMLGTLHTPELARASIEGSQSLPPDQKQMLLSSLPNDPEGYARWLGRMVLSVAPAKDQAAGLMPQRKDFNTGKEVRFVDVNPLTNPAGPAPLQMTTTPGEDLSANTSRANNAATVGATLRGQNMSDARQREANQINREAQQTQIVNDPVQGLILVNKGTKTAVQAVGADGQPIPSETAAKRTAGAGRVLALLDEAKKIIPDATGSYVGAGADLAARAVGVGTSGAQAGAKLKALEGAILAEMPRMEGPQSNADVAMYKQAAGEIGDPTTPGSVKLAAIETIRGIQQRYAGKPAAKPQAKPSVSNW